MTFREIADNAFHAALKRNRMNCVRGFISAGTWVAKRENLYRAYAVREIQSARSDGVPS